MGMSYKFKKVLAKRNTLLQKYPRIDKAVIGKQEISVSLFIPKGTDTRAVNCTPYFRDAIDAASVLFPFEPPKRIHIDIGYYSVADSVATKSCHKTKT